TKTLCLFFLTWRFLPSLALLENFFKFGGSGHAGSGCLSLVAGCWLLVTYCLLITDHYSLATGH
ncbi:MAG: hypothetical protein ACREOI_29465, partial [bacterium]